MDNINLDKIIKSDELDTNMILSVPEEIGLLLQRIIQGQATADEKNSTNIEIIDNPNGSMDIDESRKMIFKINDTLLPITLLDFPCIIEAQKTIDNKTFYKSGDIAQMMYVHDEDFRLNEEAEIASFNPMTAGDEYFNKIVWKKDYDHKYKLRSGLGKGTKNIRSRRFKRKIRYNGDEILDVAKQLKSIIDNGAANFENQMKNKEAAESVENMSIIHSASENKSSFMIPFSDNPKGSSAKKKESAPHEFNVPKNVNNISFSIKLNQNEESVAKNVLKISQEDIQMSEQIDDKVLEEYNKLKSEYKQLKNEIEGGDEDQEKHKRKKKIKKRIKEIKKLYK